jgi:hypothetical protein
VLSILFELLVFKLTSFPIISNPNSSSLSSSSSPIIKDLTEIDEKEKDLISYLIVNITGSEEQKNMLKEMFNEKSRATVGKTEED